MPGDVSCVSRSRDGLGEGPIWCPREEALYWIDILQPRLHRFDPMTGVSQEWPLPRPAGSFAVREGGGFLFAFRAGLAWLDAPGAEPQWIQLSGPRLDRGRFNDGKCDRRGRFWVGTLDRQLREPVGELYRIDPDLSCQTMDRGFTISNGLGWSPDDRTMYFTDSPARRIYAYDFDLVSGQITNRRVFAALHEGPGRPDGCTVDADGYVWTANIDAWRLLRLAPDGRVDRVVPLPVKRPTSCIFGGPSLDALYVTTSTMGLTEDDLAQQPLAGGLLRVDVGVKGVPEPRFAG